MSADDMANHLGVERESVYRLEKNPNGVNLRKQELYARALGIEPEDLWWPPGTPSLDALMRSVPDDVQAMAADIVRRLVERR